jgi:hypothetical protein
MCGVNPFRVEMTRRYVTQGCRSNLGLELANAFGVLFGIRHSYQSDKNI